MLNMKKLCWGNLSTFLKWVSFFLNILKQFNLQIQYLFWLQTSFPYMLDKLCWNACFIMSTFNNYMYVDISKHACWHATWCKLFQWWHIILHVDKIMLHVDRITLHVHDYIDKSLVDVIACRGQMYATMICICLWVDDTW